LIYDKELGLQTTDNAVLYCTMRDLFQQIPLNAPSGQNLKPEIVALLSQLQDILRDRTELITTARRRLEYE